MANLRKLIYKHEMIFTNDDDKDIIAKTKPLGNYVYVDIIEDNYLVFSQKLTFDDVSMKLNVLDLNKWNILKR